MPRTDPSCIHRRGCLEPARCRDEERCCSHDIRPPGTHPRATARNGVNAPEEAWAPPASLDMGAHDAR